MRLDSRGTLSRTPRAPGSQFSSCFPRCTYRQFERPHPDLFRKKINSPAAIIRKATPSPRASPATRITSTGQRAAPMPTRAWQPPARRGGANGQPPATTPPPPPPPQQVPTLFSSVTRDSRAGTTDLKIVNRAATPQPVRVEIGGLARVEPKGQSIALSAASPDDANSITDPHQNRPRRHHRGWAGEQFHTRVSALLHHHPGTAGEVIRPCASAVLRARSRAQAAPPAPPISLRSFRPVVFYGVGAVSRNAGECQFART